VEPWAELRGQLARASATLIVSLGLIAACVGDDPESQNNTSSSSGGSSGGSDASSSGASSGASSGTTSSGGSSGDDAAVEAGAKKCDPTKDFESIADVPGLTTELARAGRLTPDEQTIYFHKVTPARLYVATKLNGVFGPPQAVGGLEVSPGFTYEDAYPAIGTSDKVLFWESSRAQADTSVKRIYTATRTATGPAAAFTNPVVVSTLPDAVNGVSIVGNGEVVYGWYDAGSINKVFRAELAGVSYLSPVDVELGGGAEFPVVSPDEHVMYFSSTRGEGGAGAVDLFVAVRTGPTKNDAFGTAKKVANVNKPSDTNIASWLSADYCRLYFFANNEQKLKVATKTPPP
jgi:hypothetical protein